MIGDTGQHGAAVVDLADNKSTDKCQQGVLRQRTPHAADLSECGEAWPNSDVSKKQNRYNKLVLEWKLYRRCALGIPYMWYKRVRLSSKERYFPVTLLHNHDFASSGVFVAACSAVIVKTMRRSQVDDILDSDFVCSSFIAPTSQAVTTMTTVSRTIVINRLTE